MDAVSVMDDEKECMAYSMPPCSKHFTNIIISLNVLLWQAFHPKGGQISFERCAGIGWMTPQQI